MTIVGHHINDHALPSTDRVCSTTKQPANAKPL